MPLGLVPVLQDTSFICLWRKRRPCRLRGASIPLLSGTPVPSRDITLRPTGP